MIIYLYHSKINYLFHFSHYNGHAMDQEVIYLRFLPQMHWFSPLALHVGFFVDTQC
jgi:hypothetical protein